MREFLHDVGKLLVVLALYAATMFFFFIGVGLFMALVGTGILWYLLGIVIALGSMVLCGHLCAVVLVEW
jgi:hypothetical protein